MKTELERYKDALAVAMSCFSPYPGTFRPIVTEIESILNPPPEMERVEVTRWTFGDGCDTFSSEEEARDNATYSGEVYKLTGTRQIAKPQKVERSVRLNISRNGVWRWPDGTPKHDADMEGVFTYTE